MMPTVRPRVAVRDALRRLAQMTFEDAAERDALLDVVRRAEGLAARDLAWMAFRSEPELRDAARELLTRVAPDELVQALVAASRTAPDASIRAAAMLLADVVGSGLDARLAAALAAAREDDRAAARRLLLALPPSVDVDGPLWRLVASGSADERRSALAKLAERPWSAAALERWLPLAADDESGVSEIVLSTLASHAPTEAAAQLASGLATCRPAIRQRLADALAGAAREAGPELIDHMLPLVSSAEHGVRRAALGVLFALPDRRPVVRRLLEHARTLAGWVRERALESLSELGSEVLDPVVELLEDPDEEIRSGAIAVAASFDDARVVPALVTRLGDPDWWVRLTAAEALGRIGDPAAVDGLSGVLDDPEARWAAVEALGRIGDIRALPGLARLLKDPAVEVRIEVLLAMRHFTHPRILEALRRVATTDPDRIVRSRALEVAEEIAARRRAQLDDALTLRTTAMRAEVADDEPALHALLVEARNEGASDLHLSVGSPPTLRLAAELVPLPGEPLSAVEITELIQSILNAEQLERLERERTLDLCHWIPRAGRYRGNLFLDHRGLNAVFRVIPERPPTLDELGLPAHMGTVVEHHQGLFLVCGAAGSGKTTTLAALVNLFNESRAAHVITLEDPVEFVHPFKSCLINQRELGTHMTSFARGLRAALREDPDVIVIGDVRDAETVALALTAAETGHVVLATLNATGTARAVERLIESFPSAEQGQVRSALAESLRMVIAQRLLPAVGERRRVACFEVLQVTRGVAALIRDDKTTQVASAMQMGRAVGMQTFDDALRGLVTRGAITPETAWLAASTKRDFEPLVSREFLELRTFL